MGGPADPTPDPRATYRPPRKKARFIAPDLWVSLRPNGHRPAEAEPLRRDRSHRLGEPAHPPYAWRILRKGVCDGCALGVAGFHDWTIDGVHLCTTRLNLLQAQHDGRARPGACSPTSTALRELDGHGAARARPAALPDGPPSGASRASADLAGTRRSTSRRPHRGASKRRGRRWRPRSASTSPRAASPTRSTTSPRRWRASSAPTTSTTRPASATRRRPPR